MNDKTKLGATGNFPNGIISPEDEGELALGVANDGELVHINFGKSVQWFALPPDNVRGFINVLASHAAQCDGMTITVSFGEIDKTAKPTITVPETDFLTLAGALSLFRNGKSVPEDTLNAIDKMLVRVLPRTHTPEST